jgi:predicted HTH domain antitoxin
MAMRGRNLRKICLQIASKGITLELPVSSATLSGKIPECINDMPNILIPDEVLKESGLDEREVLVELACRLFDAGRLTLWSAAKLAGLGRNGIEDALPDRGISIYRPKSSDLRGDLATLAHLRVQHCPQSLATLRQ